MSPGDEQGYADDTSGGYGGTGHTRTRLPGNDPYGGARRGGRSSSRGMVTVVGVVVVLIAAIAFANRGGSNSGSSDGGSNSADKPQSAATAATGTKPVGTNASGIPAGFAHNAQGAQSAAANYSVVLGSADMFNTDRRHTIVNTVYAPNVAASRQNDLDSAYSSEKFLTSIGLDKTGAAPKGQTFVSRVIPVGTKLASSGKTDATVEVWYTSLFGLSGEASSNPVSESWFTTTYQLKWINDDWKVTDFQQKDGPVPVGRDQKVSTADDMTKAVEEFGGFTYAR